MISRDLIVRTDQNFIRANLTSTISWSTIWSVYPVVDGDEGSLSANHYMFAMQQEYDEETGALDWKVVEFVMQGSFQMLV